MLEQGSRSLTVIRFGTCPRWCKSVSHVRHLWLHVETVPPVRCSTLKGGWTMAKGVRRCGVHLVGTNRWSCFVAVDKVEHDDNVEGSRSYTSIQCQLAVRSKWKDQCTEAKEIRRKSGEIFQIGLGVLKQIESRNFILKWRLYWNCW